MDRHVTQVIVVGGGPAGAATAFHLARAGVRVTILDRAHFPRDKPCSEYMSPQASRILDEMGLLGSNDGRRVTGVTVRWRDEGTFESIVADLVLDATGHG